MQISVDTRFNVGDEICFLASDIKNGKYLVNVQGRIIETSINVKRDNDFNIIYTILCNTGEIFYREEKKLWLVSPQQDGIQKAYEALGRELGLL